MTATLLQPVDDRVWDRVSNVFWDTFVLGSPVPFPLQSRAAYERLVLDWYRSHPEHSRVVLIDGRVVGYVLVCTDQRAFEKEQRRVGLEYLREVVPTLVSRRLTSEERRFLFYRLVDGFEAWRDEDPKAVGAHAHFNVIRGFRSGLLVRDFVEHIDEMCRQSGLTHWTGQINARKGRRLGVLTGYGFHVETRTPNRTLRWLTGCEVDRLTVVREAGEITRMRAAS